MEKALKKTLSQYSGKIFLEKYLGLASLFSKSLTYNLILVPTYRQYRMSTKKVRKKNNGGYIYGNFDLVLVCYEDDTMMQL